MSEGTGIKRVGMLFSGGPAPAANAVISAAALSFLNSGIEIIGFQIPYFEEAKKMCLEAMKIVPQMKYIAWDVALTEEGPVFIEGNSFPSHAVPQFAAHYPDGIGILPEFQKFITI